MVDWAGTIRGLESKGFSAPKRYPARVLMDTQGIDLASIDIEDYGGMLEAAPLLPSRVALREGCTDQMKKLRSAGVRNLSDLLDRTSTKKRLTSLADASGVSSEYLVLLRREVNSLVPKPVDLIDLPGIAPEYIDALTGVGVRRTDRLLSLAASPEDRAALSVRSGVPMEPLLELVRLSDLIRVNGVGPVSARMILSSGVRDVGELGAMSPEGLREVILARMKEKGIEMKIGDKDTEYCIRFARLLPPMVR